MEIKNVNRRVATGAVACLAVTGLALGFAAPAHADPPGIPPAADRLLNGVGSDTTQDYGNGLAANAELTSDNSLYIGSWDATPQPDEIEIKGVTLARPNGSGAGVAALSAAAQDLIWRGSSDSLGGVIDFARSSSTPSVAGSQLVYIPFGVDALTYVTAGEHSAAPNLPSNVPTNIPLGGTGDAPTALTLHNIYSADAPTTLGGLTVGPQGSGADIVPFVPQLESGTRAMWADRLGIGDTDEFGDIVSDTFLIGSTEVDVQEHNGHVTDVVENAIMPFSIAQWLAQAGNGGSMNEEETSGTIAGVDVTDRRWWADLRQIDGTEPLTEDGLLNDEFPIVRDVFNVIESSVLTGASARDIALREAFVGGSSAACAWQVGTSTVVNLFGFATHANCGSTAIGVAPRGGYTVTENS